MSDNWIVDRLQSMQVFYASEAKRLSDHGAEIVTPHNPETPKRPDAATVATALNKASTDAASIAAALAVVLAAYQAGTLPATATKIS